MSYGYRQFHRMLLKDTSLYIYKDIEEDVETRFETSNCELECNSTERPLSKRKNKKVIGLIKDGLGGKIVTKFLGLRAKLIVT